MKMTKKFIKANEDKIYEAIKETKKRTFGCESSMHMDVEIDEGGIAVTGLHSQNWQTQNSYFGYSVRLAVVHGWNVELTEEESSFESFYSRKTGKSYSYVEDLWFDNTTYKTNEEFYSKTFPAEYAEYRKVYEESVENAMQFEIDEYMSNIDIDSMIRDAQIDE